MDALDRVKQNRDHAEIDAAIIERQRLEDVAYDAELRRRLAANGNRHYWGIMKDWHFEG